MDKLLSDDAASGQNFGWSTSLFDRTAIIGAPFANNGAAYIFEETSPIRWRQSKKLLPNDLLQGDVFGFSVAVSDGVAMVSNMPDYRVNGAAGSVYVFNQTSGSDWTQAMKLRGSDVLAGDQFGYSISISGETALIGARTASGVGAVYAFERNDAGVWLQADKLFSATPTFGFGHSVSVDGNIALIGSVFDDGSGSSTGGVFVYEKNALGYWNETALLVPDDAERFDQVGYSVSIHGNLALVGARFDDDAGEDAGAAYLFQRNAANDWQQLTKLIGSKTKLNDQFGFTVALGELGAVVGGVFADDLGSRSGAAYLFQEISPGQWRETDRFFGEDTIVGDQFGISVATSGYEILVGANGDRDFGRGTGAAYLFRVPEPTIGFLTVPALFAGGLSSRRRGRGADL